MKIAIGVPHLTTNSAKDRFTDSLIDLIDYTKSQGHQVDRIRTYRDNVTFARNKIASQAFDGEYDFLFFVDDDMTFKADLLCNLIESQKKTNADIIAGLAFLRREPHEPSMFMLASDNRTYNPVVMWATGHTIEVDAVGMACTLITRQALRKVAITSQSHKNIVGFFDNLENTGEDLRFCFKAKQEGMSIFCDTSQLVGHIVEKEISFGDFESMLSDSVKSTHKHHAESNYEKELHSK